MAHETDLAVLTARIEKLERQSRRLKHLCVVIVVAFSAIAAAQAAVTKTIAASRFALVDEDNRTRAELETSMPGAGRAGVNPILTFSDENGRTRLRVGLGQRGPTLEVIDENGKTHEYLGGPTVRPATEGR
jgi:hypothetical protein